MIFENVRWLIPLTDYFQIVQSTYEPDICDQDCIPSQQFVYGTGIYEITKIAVEIHLNIMWHPNFIDIVTVGNEHRR